METLGTMISRISSKNQIYLIGASTIDKKTLRRLARDFCLDGETLCKKNHLTRFLLRCLEAKSGEEIYEKNLIC
jgi:hypothetical protein